MIPLTEAAVVLVGGRPNARSPGAREGTAPELDTGRVTEALGEAARTGQRLAVLVGGEPTTRQDLHQILRAARETGLSVGLATSGRMLVYPKLRGVLLAGRVAYVRVALLGATAATHDALAAVPGAFAQTVEGLRALVAEAPSSLRVDVACTVLADNLDELEALVDLVTGLARRGRLSVRFVAPGPDVPAEQWPPAPRVTASVGRALARVVAGGAGLGAAWEGFAPCLLEEAAELRDETLRYGVPVIGNRALGSAIPLEAPGERSHPFPCQDCAHEATCPGAPPGLLLHEGEGALRPTRRVRANSFNYEHARDLGGLAIRAGDCAVPRLELAGPACRSVVLVDAGGASLYGTPTADFTDAEITRAKDELGQLYLDVSEGAAFDDFAKSLRRLRAHPECPGCPDRLSCCGAVVIDEAQPFLREERWLREEISRMRGRVLDVGCGEQPYRNEVAALIAAGHIEYHGLDPDAAALDAIRKSGMGGTLHLGGVEGFEWEAGYFDHVLALRSLNHFLDMERAFAVIGRLMRVDADLVLCDSPPFAMLRTPHQVRHADTHAPVGHEHYRNWTSQQVVEFLKRFPFRVDVHRPIDTETSNQWILKLMRVRDEAQP